MMVFIRRYAMLIVVACIAALGFLLFLAIVDPDNRFTRDTASVAPWASGLAAIVLATLTALYVSATEDMARATGLLAEETRLARQLSMRPAVIAELEADQSQIFWLKVRNIGNSVAYELRIACYPDMQIVSGKTLMGLKLFADGLPTLGPGAHIRTMLEFGPRILDKSDSELQHTIRLSFKDSEGTKYGPFEYPIDFSSYKGLILGEDLTKSIGTTLKDIRSTLQDIALRLSGPNLQ